MAFKLTSITSSQSASVKSTASARRMMPALFTRILSSSIFSTIAAAFIGSDKSSCSDEALPPALVMILIVSSALERLAQMTSAPAAAKLMAMAWPMPVFEPVTKASLPSSEKTSLITCLLSRRLLGRYNRHCRRPSPR